MHIKFSECRFSRSRNIIAGVEIKNGSCDPHHAALGVVSSSKS